MSRSRLLLVLGLLVLISPAAILAQGARMEFPVAIAAQEGSFEPSDDGEGCELMWQAAGTPTLRVTSSTGERFRRDLLGGEMATLPEVGEGALCLFQIDVSVAGGRSSTISIEGAELIRVSDDDLESLSGTMVLPVELGPEGAFVLADDDYLDLDLEGATRPGSTERQVPGVLRKVELPPVSPAASATPEAADVEPIDVEVHLLVHADLMIRMTSGCRIALADDQAVLIAQGGDAREEQPLTAQGRIVNAGTSPTGDPGCLFRTTMVLPPADAYAFRVGETELAEIPFDTLMSLEEPVLLQIARDGNRTRGWETADEPEREAVATPAVVGGPLGDGQFLISGQLELWSDEVVMTDTGCAGGPGNADIGPGAQVIVRNETGSIVGYGVLEDAAASGEGGCAYTFTVTVPQATYYVVEIADRGNVVYAHHELEGTGWRMALETGEK